MTPAIRVNHDDTVRAAASGFQYATTMNCLIELLDAIYTGLSADSDVADTIWRLYARLWSLRSTLSKPEWTRIIKSCREHPILSLLHENPFALRAYQKPRGYPGDAGTIDYLYRHPCTPEARQSLTPLGSAMLAATIAMPAAFAVRERMRFAAREIDLAAARKPQPTIVAMAAGHAREAAYSVALRAGKVGSFLALDQDQRSLDVIRADYGSLGIEPRHVSVQDLLQGSRPVHDADLIYALGLYDYLTDLIAQRLTAALFQMLAPGGTLLIGNFMPGILEAGAMEAFMDWRLLYRTPEQLKSVSRDVPDEDVRVREVWADDYRYLAYLRVTKVHA